MTRFRHILYWTGIAVIFFPVVIIYGIQALAEWIEPRISRFHTWAYRERYVKPWERNDHSQDLRGADDIRP